MDASPIASSALVQGRQNVATAVAQQAVKTDQQQARAINEIIVQNTQSAPQPSAKAEGVGSRVDRSV